MHYGGRKRKNNAANASAKKKLENVTKICPKSKTPSTLQLKKKTFQMG